MVRARKAAEIMLAEIGQAAAEGRSTPFDLHFAPETVERIQAIVAGTMKPARVVETPVYEYARP